MTRLIRRYGGLAVGLGALCVLAPALACWGPEFESVHFNDARPDFLRMPEPWWSRNQVRAHAPSRWSGKRQTTEDGYPLYYPPEMAPNSAASLAAARRALKLEQTGSFAAAAVTWEQYAEARRREWIDPSDKPRPDFLPGLPDRVRALRAWRDSRDTSSLRFYLLARRQISAGKWKDAEKSLESIDSVRLRTHACYLQAATHFKRAPLEQQVAAYRKVLEIQPNHIPSLYMIGRCYFSHVRVQEQRQAYQSVPMRAEHFRSALKAYEICAAAAPQDPLGRDAVGMAAACRFRLGDYPGALLTYSRQLARLRPGEDAPGVVESARNCLQAMSEADHLKFQRQVLSDPGAASVYLDFLLRYGRTGAKSNHRLGLFTLDLLRKHPSAPVSGRFLTRLSLIEDRAGRFERAERLAWRALERCRSGADRDEARWQHALALHHLRRDADALHEYELVAKSAATPRMRAGAHEAAAVLSEKRRDYANAIRHYLDLEYRQDYAYVIDCLAAPDDLRSFLRRFPTHPQRNLVRYSLGFRQLRAGEYDAAATTFATLGKWLDTAERAYPADTSKGLTRSPPLATARFLADRKRREAAAKTPTDRVRLAYETGQFLFHQRHLVFYNGMLWNGMRSWTLDRNAPYNILDRAAPLSPGEKATQERYQEEHAALHQALRVFERIADRYPNTPHAPKALYSAALCHTLLPNVERYWSAKQRLTYSAKAIHFYRRLQREYPHDPLAVAAAKYGGPLSAVTGASQ